MKEALATGSEAWWRTKTGPEWIREKDGNYRVTFGGATRRETKHTPRYGVSGSTSLA